MYFFQIFDFQTGLLVDGGFKEGSIASPGRFMYRPEYYRLSYALQSIPGFMKTVDIVHYEGANSTNYSSKDGAGAYACSGTTIPR